MSQRLSELMQQARAQSQAALAQPEEVMTPEIWTVLGTGFTLAALGITGFTLLWRYITRAEQRTRADLAAAEQRTRADLAAAEKRNEERFGELKSDLAAAEKRNEARFGGLGTSMHTLEGPDGQAGRSPRRTARGDHRQARCVIPTLDVQLPRGTVVTVTVQWRAWPSRTPNGNAASGRGYRPDPCGNTLQGLNSSPWVPPLMAAPPFRGSKPRRA